MKNQLRKILGSITNKSNYKNMLKFLGRTLIVSAAIIAVPIVFIKRIKKLDEEGFFDSKKKEDKEDKEEHKPFSKFTPITY